MSPAPTYFVDTSFWIALLQRADRHHGRAVLWQQHVVTSGASLITTEAILWEMLNYFSTPAARHRALNAYRTCHGTPQFAVEGYRPELIDAAITLYESRSDKSWG